MMLAVSKSRFALALGLTLLITTVVLGGCKAANKVSNLGNGSGSEFSQPAVPVLTSPKSSPYYTANSLTVTGTCTDGYTVNISGDLSQSAACAGGKFSILLTKNVDATFSLSVYQAKTSPKRISASNSFEWVRDSTTPTAATITSPSSSPYYSSNNITLTGTCTAGYEVIVSGSISSSTTCTSTGTFSLVLSQTTDGSYDLTLSQKNLAGTPSSTGNPTMQWVRDSAVFSTTLLTNPSQVQLNPSVTFTFSSSGSGGTFKCSMDGATFTTCTTPYTATPSNGVHTFSVAAYKPNGIPDPNPPSYSWTQAVYNTIALYHFDTSPGFTVDSSSLSGSELNTLTNAGTTTAGSAQFNQARNFALASSNSMYSTNNNSQGLGTSTMTVEGFVNLNSLPATSGTYYALMSKMGASGSYGWEFGIKRSGTNYRLYMILSSDGTTTVEVNSSNISGLGTGAFHHYAATFDKNRANEVAFFYDGASQGTASAWSGTNAIFNSSAQLTLGAANSAHYMDGIVDEVRLSKVLRTFSGSPPAAAYTPD